MAKTKTLAQIKLSIQTEGAWENSLDITGTVLTDYINKAIVRGREIITQSWRDYYTVSATTPLINGTDSYSLPTDFEHLRKIEIALDAGLTRWRKLLPADLSDSTYFQASTSRRYRYRMAGSQSIVLMPVPANNTDVIRLWYVPYATELVSDSDSITINVDAEYELYVLLALKKCKQREDLETQQIDADISECVARLRASADNRDASEPFYLGVRRNDEEDCW